MEEIWKDIEGYEGLYQVSNLGKVKSLERYKQNHSKLQKIEEKIKVIHTKTNGYQFVQLYKDNIMKNLHIHRLVAQAFIPNPENKPQVNHKDGNKQNNNINNLEWCTNSENDIHAWKTGLKQPSEKLKEIVIKNNKLRSKPIYQLDLQGKYIRTWLNAHEASRKLGIDRSTISQCCIGGRRNKTAGGYKWCFADK